MHEDLHVPWIMRKASLQFPESPNTFQDSQWCMDCKLEPPELTDDAVIVALFNVGDSDLPLAVENAETRPKVDCALNGWSECARHRS